MLRRLLRPRPTPLIQLYTRAGCSLCDALEEELRRHEERGELQVERVDIAGDAALEERFGSSIPVLSYSGRPLAKGRFTAREALRRLARRIEAEGREGRP